MKYKVTLDVEVSAKAGEPCKVLDIFFQNVAGRLDIRDSPIKIGQWACERVF